MPEQYFIFFHFILLISVHSKQSQTVTIYTELYSKATKHRQLPMRDRPTKTHTHTHAHDKGEGKTQNHTHCDGVVTPWLVVGLVTDQEVTGWTRGQGAAA